MENQVAIIPKPFSCDLFCKILSVNNDLAQVVLLDDFHQTPFDIELNKLQLTPHSYTTQPLNVDMSQVLENRKVIIPKKKAKVAKARTKRQLNVLQLESLVDNLLKTQKTS